MTTQNEVELAIEWASECYPDSESVKTLIKAARDAGKMREALCLIAACVSDGTRAKERARNCLEGVE